MALISALAQAKFSDDERQAVVRYWAEPGRYVVGAPKEAAKSGPWQVRLTAEGSTWLWNYNKVRGVGKGTPDSGRERTQTGGARVRAVDRGEGFYDRWLAARDARAANMEALGRDLPPIEAAPENPGPVPRALVDLAGNPPAFAAAVAPLRHTIRFDDGTEISYHDNVPMRPRYAYYRFPQGVMYGGQAVRSMPATELSALLAEAGVAESEGRVMRAGLDAGGRLRFGEHLRHRVRERRPYPVCQPQGRCRLAGAVLRTMKSDNPQAFVQDLRRFGVDVTEEGALQVVDPGTGAVATGRRLTARSSRTSG
jgi:hypothetical protein